MTYFRTGLFRFLDDLEVNNERAWWQANAERYRVEVKEPALRLIADFGPRLAGISPHFVADPRPNGGSLMRPYRDVRFSADKTPYKTNVGIQFRHEAGRDIHAPGFYLHLEHGACFAGVGLWHPATPIARQIRQAIHDDPSGWEGAAKTGRFLEKWSTTAEVGEMLKRVPSGLDPDHRHSDDLRMKSFVAMTRLTQKQVTSRDFVDDLADLYAVAAPFAGFLCRAVGVPF